MNNYLDMLDAIREYGQAVEDRTGTGTYSLFGGSLKFDLSEYFPLLPHKNTSFHNIAHELLWFLQGGTDLEYLHEHNVHIWDEWADENGYLGPVYGKQWRSWDTGFNIWIDQMKELVDGLINNPHGRRHIVSAWNVGELSEMALPPCHMMFQCYVGEANKLHMQMYQRSADMFLGVPYNIASYALLLCMLSTVCGYQRGTLKIVFGDMHIYTNHMDQVEELLSRQHKPPEPECPCLGIINRGQSIDEFERDDFLLRNYNPLPAIKAPIAV